jgi:hypothetical protein
LDKFKAGMYYVRGGDCKIQNNGPTNGIPILISSVTDDIKVLFKAQIYQRGVSGVFIQTIARSRVVIITLPKTHGEVLPYN